MKHGAGPIPLTVFNFLDSKQTGLTEKVIYSLSRAEEPTTRPGASQAVLITVHLVIVRHYQKSQAL